MKQSTACPLPKGNHEKSVRAPRPLTNPMCRVYPLFISRCMLDPAQGFDPAHPNISTLLRLVFAWAFVWSVGANVDDATRPRLEKWVGENFRGLVGSGSPFLKVQYVQRHIIFV